LRTIGDFVREVLNIHDVTAATAFFHEYVGQLRRMPDISATDAEELARQNIGWCFGEGMSLETRRMWRTACGAYHPVLGTMDRQLTTEELFKAGMDVAKRGVAAVRKRFYPMIPTSWERLSRDDDDDA
jgi:hypothetical protein